MKLIIKHVFLGDVLFLGVLFDLDKYIFPWQMYFIWGLAQIRGILHSGKYGNWTGNSNWQAMVSCLQYDIAP